MESNFNNENFERFLRESSDQYRMYPSENVWKNIYNVLHTRRRWFGIGLILLLCAGFVTTIMLTNSSVPATTQVVGKKEAVTASSVQPEIVEADIPITSYNNTIQRDKNSLLQPLTVTAEPAAVVNTSLVTITAPAAEIIQKELSTETIAEKAGNAAEESISNKPEVQNTLVYTPLPIHITDEILDQDSWVMNNYFLTNDRANRKGSYAVTSSGNRPLTIESVINSYTRRNKKLSFQYYFTPTISYRKLSENKSYLRSQNSGSSSYASLYGNINNVVTHKPDMGLEVGATARYSLNKRIRLRAGIQFNTSRYDIKAFSYRSELTTIALNTGYSVDSVSTVSNYRNFNGYKSDWLHNFYFQISAPVGIELKLAGDDKVQFGIAGTLQPTYILGDRAYLLSSNYKNYAEVPWLIRKWNMNTSFEAFVSYSTGQMNWQIGPQVRYQLYSSFVKEYPVKEHLFDFGLKIGVSLNK